MIITRAQQSDLSSIIAINKRLSLPGKSFVYNKRNWIRSQIDAGNFHVAKEEDVEICAALCLEMHPKSASIETIATKAGKENMGYGHALIQHAIELAREEGKKQLSVLSYSEYRAAGFYESCGFIVRKGESINSGTLDL